MNNIQKPDKFNSFADLANTSVSSNPKRVITTKKGQSDLHLQSGSKPTPNIGWMFYKDYFKDIDFQYVLKNKIDNKLDYAKIEADNAKIIDQKNSKIIDDTSLVLIIDNLGKMEQNIDLDVIYPGLITGVGITHEAGVEGEFKLGLHFDYTYGAPIIHGSSVKGLLRSVFPNFKKGKDKNPESKLIFLLEIIGSNLQGDEAKAYIKEIENEIFEGIKMDGPKKVKKRIDIYNRDIFFDAIVVKHDKNKRIVESDSITPHGTNPLKSPNPLPFLKISPGCTIRFRFDLKEGKLKAGEKIKLFTAILITLGIGAKTNVGYGQFETV